MKVKEGDVLVCQCDDCDAEITIIKACSTESCGESCDIEVTCCGKPMVLKKKEKGHCCSRRE